MTHYMITARACEVKVVYWCILYLGNDLSNDVPVGYASWKQTAYLVRKLRLGVDECFSL